MNDVKFLGVITSPDGQPTATVWRPVDGWHMTTVVMPDPSLKHLVGFGISEQGSPFKVVWADEIVQKEQQ